MRASAIRRVRDPPSLAVSMLRPVVSGWTAGRQAAGTSRGATATLAISFAIVCASSYSKGDAGLGSPAWNILGKLPRSSAPGRSSPVHLYRALASLRMIAFSVARTGPSAVPPDSIGGLAPISEDPHTKLCWGFSFLVTKSCGRCFHSIEYVRLDKHSRGPCPPIRLQA
jgi:hypothetical protein